MTVHPELLRRYRRIREAHRAIGVPGELTMIRELEALDPHGVLSRAIELGEDHATAMLANSIEFEGVG